MDLTSFVFVQTRNQAALFVGSMVLFDASIRKISKRLDKNRIDIMIDFLDRLHARMGFI